MEGIFLIDDEGNLTEMNEKNYDSEKMLQILVSKYPNILAGRQIDSEKPRRWLLVSPEIGLPTEEAGSQRWLVDHLFLDQYGIPTLVEVKRRRDTRIRREVVGQMLDYAANAVLYLPIGTIRREFEANYQALEADTVLEDFLTSDDREDEPDREDFWQQVDTNLRAGKIRLIFVADKIPQSLQRIVEFLNSQMDPAEVLAIEVKQFVSESGLKTLVPRVLGQTAVAQQKRSQGAGKPTRNWNETSWYEHLEANQGRELTEVVRKLSEWSKDKFYHVRSSGRIDSKATQWTRLRFANHSWRIFGIRADGKVEFRFTDLKKRPPFDSEDLRKDLRKRLNAVPGVTISDKGSALTGWPTFELRTLKDPEAFAGFCQVLDWIYQQISDCYSE